MKTIELQLGPVEAAIVRRALFDYWMSHFDKRNGNIAFHIMRTIDPDGDADVTD